MPLTLYYAPAACSMAPHAVLEELGVPYDAVEVDITRHEQEAEAFVRLNPRKRVPVLVVDDAVLTEDIAILLYLAARYPEAKLVPDEPFAYGRCIEWLSFLATGPHVIYGEMLHPDRVLSDEAQRSAVRTQARERLAKAYADIDSRLTGADFVVGEHFTVADAHLFVFYHWGVRAHLLDRAPALKTWGAAMAQRSAIQRMAAAEGIKVS